MTTTKIIKGRPLKNIEENNTGKNLKFLNIKTKKVIDNKDLEKLAKKKKLLKYILVKPKKIGQYVKSKPNNKKWDNLDPIIKPKQLMRRK